MDFCFRRFVSATTMACVERVSFHQLITVLNKTAVNLDVLNDSISFKKRRNIF